MSLERIAPGQPTRRKTSVLVRACWWAHEEREEGRKEAGYRIGISNSGAEEYSFGRFFLDQFFQARLEIRMNSFQLQAIPARKPVDPIYCEESKLEKRSCGWMYICMYCSVVD